MMYVFCERVCLCGACASLCVCVCVVCVLMLLSCYIHCQALTPPLPLYPPNATPIVPGLTPILPDPKAIAAANMAAAKIQEQGSVTIHHHSSASCSVSFVQLML